MRILQFSDSYLVARRFNIESDSSCGCGSEKSMGEIRSYNLCGKFQSHQAESELSALKGNIVRIQDYESTIISTKDAETELFLSRRHGNGVNAFWLSHGNEQYPYMIILVKDGLASLHYFPRDADPGMRSSDGSSDPDSFGMTTFYLNSPSEKLDVINDSIVPFELAVEAAKQFSKSREAPSAVRWFAL